MTRAFVLLNPAAHGGRGRARFDRVRAEVARRFECEPVELDAAGAWREHLAASLRAGVRVVIAAGGDGTVHAALNAIDAHRDDVPMGDFTLGAVGLGSSNDFHKPAARVIEGVPVRLDAGSASPRDLVAVRYADAGPWQRSLFVVSASVGLTATANAFFNAGDAPLHALRSRWSDAAIVYAALHTIASHRDLPAEMRIDGARHVTAITNLSVLKTPYLSGSFRYDTPVAPADGAFAVNLLEGLGRARAVAALVDLARGRFVGRLGARHWSARRLELDLDRAHDLELDGEVVRARRAVFEVLPERIRVCA